MKILSIMAAITIIVSPAMVLAGQLDDVKAAAAIRAKDQAVADQQMLSQGEMTIEYAQRYVAYTGGMTGPYGQKIYAYIYAGKGGQIPWNGELLKTFRIQQRGCQNATSELRQVEKENALILAGYSGQSNGYRTLIETLGQKRHNYAELERDVCMGVIQAAWFADQFEKAHPETGNDLFSK
jgi:hypothetical protein